MDRNISFKETKSLVCLFCGDVNMFGMVPKFAMVTHNYFAAGTLSSSTLCRMYLVLRDFAFLVI